MAPYDPFWTIPSPILLSIVKLSPDLSSFRSLDKASPCVASLFDECGAEITEAIMCTSLAEQIRNLIRAVAIIRSGSVRSQSLDEFIDTYLSREQRCEKSNHLDCLRRTNPAPDLHSESCCLCSVTPPSFKIAASTSPFVLRSILDSADQIQNLTGSCLQTMLDRCSTIQPSHMLDPSFRYRHRPLGGNKCPQRRPLGQPYQPRHLGPPSWVEYERTSRAFWRLQLQFDLNVAFTTSLFRWPLKDAARLESIKLFWEAASFGWAQYKQMKTVIEFCQELGVQSNVTSLLDYRESLSRLPHVDVVPGMQRPIPQFSKSFELDNFTSGCLVMSGTHFKTISPVRDVDFSFFRRLGLCIWDCDRLAALGLVNPKAKPGAPPHDIVFSQHNLWFTWESLLGQEEIESRERKRIAQFPEKVRAFGSQRGDTYWVN